MTPSIQLSGMGKVKCTYVSSKDQANSFLPPNNDTVKDQANSVLSPNNDTVKDQANSVLSHNDDTAFH